jgi:hypothetical protein
VIYAEMNILVTNTYRTMLAHRKKREKTKLGKEIMIPRSLLLAPLVAGAPQQESRLYVTLLAVAAT